MSDEYFDADRFLKQTREAGWHVVADGDDILIAGPVAPSSEVQSTFDQHFSPIMLAIKKASPVDEKLPDPAEFFGDTVYGFMFTCRFTREHKPAPKGAREHFLELGDQAKNQQPEIRSLEEENSIRTDRLFDLFYSAMREAGKRIDPDTAEVLKWFAYISDPYLVHEMDAYFHDSNCIDEQYFARAADSDLWVCFSHIPPDTVERLKELCGPAIAAGEYGIIVDAPTPSSGTMETRSLKGGQFEN